MTIGEQLRKLSCTTQTLQWRARYRAACYSEPESVRWINGEPYQRRSINAAFRTGPYSWLISLRTMEAV
jgi:hypothetical protein